MGVADVVDRVLEFAVVPSFSRIGYAARSRLDHWTPVDRSDLTGRVVVITGATSGLGLAAARTLSAGRTALEIVARNEAKAIGVRERLRAVGAPGGINLAVADTGDLDGIRRVAGEVARRHDRVDALVHAAGALDATYALSPQGIEHTVASQVVGPFLLTHLLVPLLHKGASARVVWVSSGGMYAEPLSVAGLEMGPGHYNGTRAYARAKRAQVTLAQMWADPAARRRHHRARHAPGLGGHPRRAALTADLPPDRCMRLRPRCLDARWAPLAVGADLLRGRAHLPGLRALSFGGQTWTTTSPPPPTCRDPTCQAHQAGKPAS